MQASRAMKDGKIEEMRKALDHLQGLDIYDVGNDGTLVRSCSRQLWLFRYSVAENVSSY